MNNAERFESILKEVREKWSKVFMAIDGDFLDDPYLLALTRPALNHPKLLTLDMGPQAVEVEIATHHLSVRAKFGDNWKTILIPWSQLIYIYDPDAQNTYIDLKLSLSQTTRPKLHLVN